MIEIELSEKDYDSIMGIALDYFKEKAAPRVTGESNFLAKCYVNAMISYFINKGWTIKDGKICKNTKNKIEKEKKTKKLQGC